MEINLLLLFIGLNFVNVIIQTVKSLCTIKSGKWIAAIMNAVTFGFYTVVMVYMLCDLPLLWKAAIVGACNFVGVFIVKWIEEKRRPQRLWKVEMALPVTEKQRAHVEGALEVFEIPFNYQLLGNWTVFNCYCETSKDTERVTGLCKAYNGKISAYESKPL